MIQPLGPIASGGLAGPGRPTGFGSLPQTGGARESGIQPGQVARFPGQGEPVTPAAPGETSGPSFLDALGEAVARLNGDLVAADAAAADFAAGGSTDLHEVVLALTEAGLGLRLGVAVRDRLLEAYQEIMRLQI